MIATEDGREMYVPNNIMLQAMVLRDASSHGPVPVVFSVEVDLSVDPDQLKEILAQAASREPRLVAPVEVQVKSMAPRSMVLEFRSTWEGGDPSEFSRFVGNVLRQEALSSQGKT